MASIAIWASIGFNAILTLVLIALAANDSTPSIGNSEASMVFLGALGLLQPLALVTSVVLVALWVYQAHRNLHDARLGGLNYTPGWATASFFVPFVNLWVPFASTRELYNRSIGKSDWHAATSAGDVSSWYACSWASLAVLAAISFVALLQSIPGLYVLMPMWAQLGLLVLLAVFVCGSAYFLAQIVRKVTRAQVELQHVGQADVFA